MTLFSGVRVFFGSKRRLSERPGNTQNGKIGLCWMIGALSLLGMLGSTFAKAAGPQLAFIGLVDVTQNKLVTGYEFLPPDITINLANLQNRPLSIIAQPAAGSTIGSVKFELNGSSVRMENTAPYALCNDGGSVPYDCQFTPGTITVKATAYSGPNGTGTVGNYFQTRITFTNQSGPSISGFTLINADNGAAVAGYNPIQNGATIELSDLPSPRLSMRANAGSSGVGSVVLSLDGVQRVQTQAPYALCDDANGVYFPCALGVGGHTISATPYSGPGATGVAGPTYTIAIYVSDNGGGATGGPLVVWANDGGDKVTRDETRGADNYSSTYNTIWDGGQINIFGGKNEVVSFNLVIESPYQNMNGLSVRLNSLTGPGGYVLSQGSASADGVFNYVGRQIELFFVRYLRIEGLSVLSYNDYDERHVPSKLRRQWNSDGWGVGSWWDRPNHDKEYPEIAVPHEWVPSFSITSGNNQSIWADIYIPKSAPAGYYTGNVNIMQSGQLIQQVPVSLRVRNFTLPDVSASKTMTFLGYSAVNKRYTGVSYPNVNTSADATAKLVRDRHFMMAKRHKIALIDPNDGSTPFVQDHPRDDWVRRLNGSLFTSSNGYEGPGAGTGNGVFAIGPFGSWSWKDGGESAMRSRSDSFVNWFNANSPQTEYFIYLADESQNYSQIQQWASWIQNNPGPGKNLMSFATMPLPTAQSNTPALDIAASWFAFAPTSWQNNVNQQLSNSSKRFYMYNAKRPASGSFATEDDGTALRELPWGQFKKGVQRWFFWESTYYFDNQSGRGEQNVFRNAQTFGSYTGVDNSLGKTGWNYSNGDGVLFYPGTDTLFPSDSYGRAGPIASLRLKHWRRGIQDVDYLTLARAKNPTAVQQIINQRVPKVLWEVGTSPGDTTWVRSDIGWSSDPDDWEDSRAALANIIEN